MGIFPSVYLCGHYKGLRRKENPRHPEAGLVSQQGDALLPLDVEALTELQPHTGSPQGQE